VRKLWGLFSLLLIAVWLPATLHCNLEAADVVPRTCADACYSGDKVSSDSCGVLEGGIAKAQSDAAKVSAPILLAGGPFIDLQIYVLLPPLDSAKAVPAFARPLDWVTTWHFVRRAAPPSRAPALSLA
jgi:hypothetical protein